MSDDKEGSEHENFILKRGSEFLSSPIPGVFPDTPNLFPPDGYEPEYDPHAKIEPAPKRPLWKKLILLWYILPIILGVLVGMVQVILFFLNA